jgi:hypothetical protein
MPRSKKSQSGRILDYFRHSPLGEVKVVHQLAGDIIVDRFQVELDKAAPPRKAVVTRSPRKAAQAAQPTPTEEAVSNG